MGFNLVLSWLSNNKLNVGKTKCMAFSIKTPTLPTLNNTADSYLCLSLHNNSCSRPTIHKTDIIKYLGVTYPLLLTAHRYSRK